MTGLWRIALRGLLVLAPAGAAGLVYGAVTQPVAPAPLPAAVVSPHTSEAGDAPPTPAPFRLASLPSFGGMVERPMFTPTRRPYVADAAAPPAPAAVAPQPVFNAVVKAIVLAEEGRMTLIGRTGQKGTQLVAEGDDVDGWTVSAITQDAVQFRQGSREMRLFAAPPLPGAVLWEADFQNAATPHNGN